PRRPPAAAGHGIHDRARCVLRRLRRADGNQHDRRRDRRDDHRRRAERHRLFDLMEKRMSTRKITFLYVPLVAVMSLAVGMVLASRLGMTPASMAQTITVPPMNSAPIAG